jgi:N-carbamoyl-L-amino-acid hydrolase
MFARRPGRDNALAPVGMGSHLDSQPTGGKYDGAFGVLAALEVLRTLNDLNYETLRPIEVINWTNEEGCRFAPAMLASGVFAGRFDLDYALARTAPDGASYGAELRRIGFAGEAEPGDHALAAFFECHIEQGPILEDEGKTIGVVTGAQGQRWFAVTLTGEERHAGTTPMPIRRDALVAAAQLVERIQRIALEHAPDAVATVGSLSVFPDSPNVIPGGVRLTVDMRNPDDSELSSMKEALLAALGEIAEASGVAIEHEEVWYTPPVPFDPDCIGMVREGAERGGYPHRDIVSGAGHDAVNIAAVAPAAMIFIPCADGVSHAEHESATPEDVAAGCDVLLHAVVSAANRR